MWAVLFKIIPLAISVIDIAKGFFKKKKIDSPLQPRRDNKPKKPSKPIVGDHDGDGYLTGADKRIENARKRSVFREKWLSKITNKFRRI